MKRPSNRRPPTGVSMSAQKLPADPIELPEGMWQRIAQKAYELYEQRKRRDGHSLGDCFEAKAIEMGRDS